ncbi:MAG: hypothetical protein ACFFDW_10670 [Candidatus Thorarchaeota archaeon]
MSIICPECEEKNNKNTQECVSCGKKFDNESNSVNQKLYSKLTITSFVISQFSLGFFSWFPILLIYDIIPNLSRYDDLSIIITFALIILAGIILGAISIKKGNLTVIVMGLIINCFGLIGMVIYFALLP